MAESHWLLASGFPLPASGSQLPADGGQVALPEWIPLRVHPDASGASVDWCDAGGASFSEPFFEDTIDRLRRASRTARTPIDVLIAEAAAHPGLGRQDQALSLSRPLCRRAARTARPARVRMRSRKPCVLARRRLFGWNVRLLTGGSR